MTPMIPLETIQGKICVLRGQRVMFDFDLAALYGIKTKILKQAVNRNLERFPEDFMFKIAKQELENLRSQIVTSNLGAKMGPRYSPYVFTEQGIAMLSSVLRTPQAVNHPYRHAG